jgi:hypothetical protein
VKVQFRAGIGFPLGAVYALAQIINQLNCVVPDVHFFPAAADSGEQATTLWAR